jgi:hypothetical protein
MGAWWGCRHLTRSYHAFGARTRPACIGSVACSLEPAESCAGCRLARLDLFWTVPGVCRPLEGLMSGPNSLWFDVGTQFSWVWCRDPRLMGLVSELKVNESCFMTQFSSVWRQDPRVIERASGPNSLGFDVLFQG